MSTATLGVVDGYVGASRTIQIPEAILVIGPAAICAYVGLVIGGPKGAVVGGIVGGFVGKLAGAGKMTELEITLNPNGQISARWKFT